MATISFRSARYPVGTSVGLYLRSQSKEQVGLPPLGPAVGTATVGRDNSVTFTDVDGDQHHVAYAVVDGEDRYVTASLSSAE